MNDRLSKPGLILILISLLNGIGFAYANTSNIPETGSADVIVQSSITANDLKPPECAGLDLTNIVTGGGAVSGTPANDLILGSAGSDTLDSLGGNDCLVGGDGNDLLFGSADGLPASVADLFDAISFSNDDGTQFWGSSWNELGEVDGPASGDVSVEVISFSGVITATADQDAYVTSRNPDTNYGSVSPLTVSAKANNLRQALYRFDLSQLPAGANIITATVSLFVIDQNNRPVNIHRITSDWTESAITWNNGSGSFDPAPSASFVPEFITQYITTDITSLVQQWVSGAAQNYGIMLVGRVNNQTSYASRESSPDQVPYLTIRYSITTTEQAMRIQNASKGGWRQADLAGSVAATLQFSYQRLELDDALDYVAVEISNTGGASWVELARFTGPANDIALQPAIYDISGYIASDTRIRFTSSNTLGFDDRVYFDNITIDFLTTNGGDDVLLGGAGDDSLDGGPGLDACYGWDGSDIFISCETIIDP